jgi:hydroxymethylpyrimidine pyrophosphatase-like HAD family hydrolase
MRRWLVSDLDGTLIDRSQRIAERDAAAVAEFRAAGGAVLLATGRTERSALPYHRMLDLDTPLIVYNGARIVGPDGAVLYARDLGAAWPALRDRLLPGLPAGVAAVGFAAGAAHTLRPGPGLAEYARSNGIALVDAPPRPPVTKLMLVATSPAELAGLEQRVSDIDRTVGLVRSEPTYLEVLPAGVDKGSALRHLAHRCGVPLARVAAIGDNPNDVPLLQAAGLGAAVGDGDPAAQRAADVVVGPCGTAIAELVALLLAEPSAGTGGPPVNGATATGGRPVDNATATGGRRVNGATATGGPAPGRPPRR